MPRQKTINMPSIKLEKINQEIVEQKNCLGVELTFNNKFESNQVTLLRRFYRFAVSSDDKVLSGKVKNSWKSLTALFVSIAYCKYGEKVVAKISNSFHHAKLNEELPLRVDFFYEAFLAEDEREELQKKSVVSLTQEEFFEAYQNREQFQIEVKQRRLQTFLDLLKNRAPDPAFENVIAPASWRPCYISAKYEAKNIVDYIKVFSELLEIDGSKSIIQTDFAKQLPHKYKITPAVYHNDFKWRTY